MSGVKREVDFYRIVKRFLTLSRRVLSSPYDLDDEKRLIVHGVQFWVQNLITFILSYLTLANGIRFILQLQAGNPYVTMGILHNMWRNCYMVFALCQWRMQKRQVMEIFEKIKRIEKEVEIDKKLVKHFSRKYWKWVVTIVLAPVVFLTKLVLQKGLSTESVIHASLVVWSMFQPLISCTFLWMFLMLTTYYTVYVNCQLKSSLGERVPVHTDIYVVDGMTNNNLKEDEKVRNIRKLLKKVTDLKEVVNDSFGNRIWIKILHIFIEIVFFVFLNVTIIKYFRGFSTRAALLDVIMVNCYMAMHVYRFLEFVKICSALGAEGEKTSILVHEILAETLDGKVRNELSIFSLELLHRQSKLNAKGYFDVDCTLLSALAWGSVVQTIGLLQFNFPGYGNDICPFEDLIALL